MSVQWLGTEVHIGHASGIGASIQLFTRDDETPRFQAEKGEQAEKEEEVTDLDETSCFSLDALCVHWCGKPGA